MQQEGAWSSNYMQALRIPLEQISGVSSGGTFIKQIRILVGASGASDQHIFIPWHTDSSSAVQNPGIYGIVEQIQKHLKKVREEKKRLALEALAKETVPAMIFCKYCGARNKSH